ncbi:MAG: type II secretion system protein [Planctomycetota bacterium]|jgi:type II secretory pathway pseudopilin PulG
MLRASIKRPRGSGAPQAAFTLVEVLAATLCVGVLIAIVEPSLEAARQRSKQSTCLDRLRQIGEATAVYSDEDPAGAALPVHEQTLGGYSGLQFVGAYEWGGKSGIGRPCAIPGPCVDEYSYLTSRYGTNAGFGPPTRPLNQILYPHGFRDTRYPQLDRIGAELDTMLELTVYKCPADDGPPSGGHCPEWIANADRSSFDHFGTSYAANLFMNSYVGGGTLRSNSPYLRPALDVPAPARTINYEENIGRWAWACRREVCDFIQPGVDPGPTKAVRGWHGKNWTYNRAFGDAHAESQAVFIEGTEDAEGYSQHYRTEIVFDDPGQQDNSRCIIVRGDGWQKDTLPAEPVETGLIWDGGSARPSYEDCVTD